MGFHDQPNWQEKEEVRFHKIRQPIPHMKAKVASETWPVPPSSNFASFVPRDQALERHHLFTDLSTGLQLSASNTVETHTSNGRCLKPSLIGWHSAQTPFPA